MLTLEDWICDYASLMHSQSAFCFGKVTFARFSAPQAFNFSAAFKIG